MKNQSSESYLDQLLNSIEDGDGTPEMGLSEALKDVPMDDFEKELFGESGDSAGSTAAGDDFLREFEEELLKDGASDLSDDFLRELDAGAAGGESDAMDASIADMISHMDTFGGGADGEAPQEGQAPEAGESLSEPEPADGPGGTVGEIPTEEPLGEDGEVDLSGISSNDLLDILAGEDDLSDLGDLLSADSTGTEIGDTDEFGNFAEAELKAQQEEAEAGEEDGGRKKKKRKRKDKDKDGKQEGFMKKLGRIFFGEDEPEDQTVSLSASDSVDVNQLSAENQQILQELENAGEEEDKGKKGKDKKKKKKEKKEKKEKPPKEPKPKKEKPPKPKKEKKPKEKDNTPPLPKGPVIAILIMVGSLFGLVVIGTRLMGYQTNVSQAKEFYAQGAYAEAYEQLSGLDIQEKEMKLYNQLAILAPVSAEYNTYLIFSNAGYHDMAVDALICAYGRYDTNLDSAREYECLGELETLGGKIVETLLEDYNITGSDALELYHQRTRKLYTIELHRRLQELGLE